MANQWRHQLGFTAKMTTSTVISDRSKWEVESRGSEGY
jgi:hypothetical protein